MSRLRTSCSERLITFPIALLILLGMMGVIFAIVSITEIVKEDPAASRSRSRPKPRPQHRASGRTTPRRQPDDDDEATTADRLERAAEVTGRYHRPLAWMDPRTIPGKLTMAAWLNRWWASGSYMRRRMIVSAAWATLIIAVFWIGLALMGV